MVGMLALSLWTSALCERLAGTLVSVAWSGGAHSTFGAKQRSAREFKSRVRREQVCWQVRRGFIHVQHAQRDSVHYGMVV